MEEAVAKMLEAHRSRDEGEDSGEADAPDAARIERLQGEARAHPGVPRHHAERRSAEGGNPQEQRHRQRQRQDGHLQGRDPGLHGGGGGR